MEVSNMPDRKTEIEKSERTLKIGALKLRRETLRDLDTRELEQARGGGKPGPTHFCTRWCDSYSHCTRGCGYG
jgi:hypothetical protein